MVNKEVYDKIHGNMKDVDKAIDAARDALRALQEVGRDTTELKIKLDNLEKDKIKWVKMLQNRGYDI